MKDIILTVCSSALFALCAIAVSACTQESTPQSTPGYNNNIPEAIMTPDKVETRLDTIDVLRYVKGERTPFLTLPA